MSRERRRYLAFVGGLTVWLVVLAAVGFLKTDTALGNTSLALLFGTWALLGSAFMLTALLLKLRLREQLPEVLGEYDVGSLFVSWSYPPLLDAAQDSRVLSDSSIRPLALSFCAVAAATFAPALLVLLGAVIFTAIRAFQMSDSTPLFVALFGLAITMGIGWPFFTAIFLDPDVAPPA